MADLPDPESLRELLAAPLPIVDPFVGSDTRHMGPESILPIRGSEGRIRGGKSWTLTMDLMRSDTIAALLPQPVIGVEPDPEWARIVRERLDLDSKGDG